MSNVFDLSPVRGLLRVLPATNSTTHTIAPPLPAAAPTSFDAQDIRKPRQLGDFAALWQFLETTGTDSEPLSASSNKIRSESDAEEEGEEERVRVRVGEVDALPLNLSKKKQKRAVKFAAKVGISRDKNSSEPAVFADLKAASPDGDEGGTGVKAFVKHVTRPVIEPNATPEVRKANIIQRLMEMFPNAAGTLLSPSAPVVAATTGRRRGGSGIHVFVDNSNILIGFYDHIKNVRGYDKNDAIRRPSFSFHGLSLILERGRGAAKRVLVGSSPITTVILEARELGYETSILERVEKEVNRGSGSASSGSESAVNKRRKVEQAVDEICHLKILESVLDYAPSIIVLASGDGAVAEYSPGFFKVIERCLMRGWMVELFSFKRNLSGFYRDRDFKKRWKNQFRFVALDDFAEDLLS